MTIKIQSDIINKDNRSVMYHMYALYYREKGLFVGIFWPSSHHRFVQIGPSCTFEIFLPNSVHL